MMACATTKPTLCFNMTTKPKSKPKHNPNLTFTQAHPLKTLLIQFNQKTQLRSTDVSKEDKPPPPPISDEPISPEPEKFDKRRLEEKFAVLNTGIFECKSCGYKYDECAGDPSYPIPPGFGFDKLPEDWRCPTCGAAKSFFESKSVEIAGFAENQQFGLGGNALTSGQKGVLIYGGLFFFFALFLSGYFLQ